MPTWDKNTGNSIIVIILFMVKVCPNGAFLSSVFFLLVAD
jgi:hypothetical protein